jgi:hypothetical protein
MGIKEKNVIAYSLYGKKTKSVRRHDPLRNDNYRYWYNIPIIIIANSEFFKDSVSKFFVHKNMITKPVFDFLQQISESTDKVEIKILDDSYKDSKPMLWRLKPLWYKKVKFCFCRDIDSIPEQKEVQSVRFFKQAEEMHVHSMRCHPHHNSIPIYGGLCGFNAALLRDRRLITSDYNELVSPTNKFKWGDDQRLLVRYFFSKRNRKFVSKVLDCPIRYPVFDDHRYMKRFDRPHAPVKRRRDGATYFKSSVYDNVDISDINSDVLDICNKITLWGGQPVDGRDYMNAILEASTEESSIIKSLFRKNPEMRKFYKVR